MRYLIAVRAVLLLNLSWAILMNVLMQPYQMPKILPGICNTETNCKLIPPIAALELAPGTPTFRKALDPGSPATFKQHLQLALLNTRLDLIFIPLYTALFVLVASYGEIRFAHWTIAAIAAAAVFDYIEDAYLFSALDAFAKNVSPAHLPNHASHIKWTFFATACFLLGVCLFRNRGSLVVQLNGLHQSSGTARGLIRFSLSVVVATVLFTALLTLFGQHYLALLKIGTASLTLAFLALLFLLFPVPVRDWFAGQY